MFCPNCGAQVGGDELFCGNCGTRVRSPAEVSPPAGKSYNPDEQPAAPRRRRSPLATVGIVLLVLILVGGTAATVIFMLGQSNQPAVSVAVIQPSMTPEQPDAASPVPTHTLTQALPTLTQTFTQVPPTLTPTFTSVPPTLTPTVPNSELIPAGWHQVLYDTFDSDAGGWPLGDQLTDVVDNRWSLSEGWYRWEATAHKVFSWNVLRNESTVSDFYLSVDARQVSGTDEADYGFVFRRSEGKYYRFGIQETGLYYFVRWVDGVQSVLIPWLPTSAVRAGEVNRIVAIGRGSHFTFYVNDQLIAEFDDAGIPSGSVGLDIGFDTPGAVAEVEYDNFILYTP